MTPPSLSGGLPEQAPRPPSSATLHYQSARSGRRVLTLEARGSRELDAMVIARIDDLRVAGNRMVRTEMTIDGERWTYEYDSTGEIENIFRNGEVTP